MRVVGGAARGWLWCGAALAALAWASVWPAARSVWSAGRGLREGGGQRQMTRDPKTGVEERRVALVIGNAAYRKARALANPVNDARAMARALRELGFEVLGPGGGGYADLTLGEMVKAVQQFRGRLREGGGVGVFYFAGHGMEVGGKNYLIPVEADPQDEVEVKYQALDVRDVLEVMAGNRLNIVILDACRDNPFGGEWARRSGGSRGLALMEAPSGTLIAYATGPGKTAKDGYAGGKNGLYTEVLLAEMGRPGVSVEQVFKRVRVEVERRSRGEQIPWEMSSLKGEFYFRPGGGGEAVVSGEKKPEGFEVEERILRGTVVVRVMAVGMDVEVDGKRVGVSKAEGQEFVVRNVEAGRVLRVAGRKAGSVVERQVRVEANGEAVVELRPELPGEWRNGAGMTFVLVRAGSYERGSTEADERRWNEFLSKYQQRIDMSDERPRRRVRIGRDFYLGKYEVTQAQWRYVAEKLPRVKRELNANPSYFGGCDECPVERVSWEDCEEFVLRLNRAYGDELGMGYVYRLPTEAEWEYACRAGTEGDYAGDLDAMGWYGDNSGERRLDSLQAWRESGGKWDVYWEKHLKPNGNRPRPVGRKRANGWGLYDMHGNVWEWCWDWYGKDYYGVSPEVDPRGPGSGEKRVRRGGAWDDDAPNCRAANRSNGTATFRYNNLGMRVAVGAPLTP